MTVISIDDFLEPEDLIKYQNYVLCSGLSQKIKEDHELTTEFWNKYGDKLNQNLKDITTFSGLYPYVTITNSNNPVFKHIDSKFFPSEIKCVVQPELQSTKVPTGNSPFLEAITLKI